MITLGGRAAPANAIPARTQGPLAEWHTQET
jgi:hypothetical protein